MSESVQDLFPCTMNVSHTVVVCVCIYVQMSVFVSTRICLCVAVSIGHFPEVISHLFDGVWSKDVG